MKIKRENSADLKGREQSSKRLKDARLEKLMSQENMDPSQSAPEPSQPCGINRGMTGAAQVNQVSKVIKSTGVQQAPPRTLPTQRTFGTSLVANSNDASTVEVDERGLRTVGTAGHLEKIRLENFMCHEVFELKFGPHVTLVSGTNGSGKSAIMQGLQACLGVSARSTGRASSLAQFVKTGCSETRVQVTLFNTGPDAFEPEKFGDRIMIERRLTTGQGGNHWKLFNSSGRVVTDRKPADVLKYLGVNASNPLTIITQDMTRGFFGNSADDKRKKYNMFMEGTYLEDIKQEHAASDTNLYKSFEHLKKLDQEYKENRKELKDVEQRLEKLKDVDKHISLKSQVEDASVWVLTWEARKRLGNLRSGALNLGPKRKQQLEKEVGEAETALAAVCEEEKAKMEAIAISNQSAQTAAADLQRLKAAYRECMEERKRVQQQHEALRQEVSALNEQKESYDKALQEDNSEKVKAQQAALQALEEKLNECRSQCQDADEALSAQRAAAAASAAQRDDLASRLDSARRELSQLSRKAEEYQRNLHEIHASRTNSVHRFGGKSAADLLAKLRQNLQQFDREPIGPLGMYLGLNESRWATAAESAIGGMLNSFVCHSMKDCSTLRDMARKCGVYMQSFTVTQCNFDTPKHRVSLQRTPDGHPTLYEVLVVTDPSKENVIMNLLVDKANVEKTVLVNNGSELRRLLYEDHARFVYDSIGTKGVHQGAATRMITAFHQRFPPRLGMSQEQAAQQLSEALESTLRQLAQVRATVLELEHDLSSWDVKAKEEAKAEVECGKRKKRAKSALDVLSNQMQQQQQELNRSGQEGTSAEDLEDELATQAQNCRRDMIAAQLELDQIAVTLREAKAAEEEAKGRFEERKSLLARRSDEMEEHSREVERIARVRATASQHVSELKNKLQSVSAKVDQLVEQLNREEREIGEMEAGAEQITSEASAKAAFEAVRASMIQKLRSRHERQRAQTSARGLTDQDMEQLLQQTVDSQLTHEGLEKELRVLDSQISAAERDAGGNKEELEHTYEMMTKKVVKMKASLLAVKETVDALRAALTKRQNDYERMKDHVRDDVSNRFNGLMYRRSHLGRVEVNEENQELVLMVQVKGANDKTSKPVTDLKQLSGGERSYTTVSFLLAVGNYSECPFKCMDEFDVFMDPVNRRVATETLLEAAFLNASIQHIFLTPQDIQTVEDARKQLCLKLKLELPNHFLKIVQMKNARQ
ncbi:hypothetical protein CEUSTIGMA_g11438.t1 [Chlamydomonas eustigma]|uniref:RecF/RecN/SMC N-terminal domain-containing protein n=1 Tax=Chlamydomonas eustigma TaxID=1157962 RepID=A0A250XLV2_9CHLO|nr:hypothetical protein CEUSTIGMA_g11438.t1 [Chlamydomonas eustigma]|eukprot:GAX84013.1 hypothetical protein CEUSTIGMA_g11438.t1 [Chlamydomonas eustigma]